MEYPKSKIVSAGLADAIDRDTSMSASVLICADLSTVLFVALAAGARYCDVKNCVFAVPKFAAPKNRLHCKLVLPIVIVTKAASGKDAPTRARRP